MPSTAAAKSPLEKAWDLIQSFYAIFILASYSYVTNVQEPLKKHPWLKDGVLMTFGVLWCLLGFGYRLHFHATSSKKLQKWTSAIASIYGILFSVLVVLPIYCLIESEERAKRYLITKVLILFVGHTVITIWSCCKGRGGSTNGSSTASLLPVTTPSTTPNEGTWAANRPPCIPPPNHVPNSAHIWPVENRSSYGVGNVGVNMNALAGSGTCLQRSSLPEHRNGGYGATPAVNMQANDTGVRLQGSPLSGCRSGGATSMARGNNVLATSSARWPTYYKSPPQLERKRVAEDHSLLGLNSDRESASYEKREKFE